MRAAVTADAPFKISASPDRSLTIIRPSPEAQSGLHGFLLADASVTETAGIRFLTGHGIERVDGIPAGPRINIPLDTIGTILEFESFEAYKQFEEQHMEPISNTDDEWQPKPSGRAVPAQAPDA